MIYIKKTTEIQEVYVPKNGEYEGKKTYKEGFEEGIEYQKSKLSSLTVTTNGVYTNEDGYNEVNVEVEGGSDIMLGTYEGDFTPNEGNTMVINASEVGADGLSTITLDGTKYGQEEYEKGVQNQKELLDTITITENGTYQREDGYNQVIVDIPDDGSYDEGYNQGKEDGINVGIEEQKSKLESITITENGTYTREDGYNEVVVNVEGGDGGECKLVEGYITTNGRHYPPQSSPNGIFVHDKAFYKDDWVMTDDYMQIRVVFQVPEVYDIPTIFGLEGQDWNNTTFGARIYEDRVAVRCGGEYLEYDVERGKFYTLEVILDDEALYTNLGEWGTNYYVSKHKERYEGMYEAQNGYPIYFGGMNNLAEGGLFRPLDGIIGEIFFRNANLMEILYPEYLNYINGNGDVVGNWVGEGGRIWKQGVEGGADGFSFVEVHVQGDGYDVGFQDGQAVQKSKLEPITITENGVYQREDGYSEVNVDVKGGNLTTLVATKNGTYQPFITKTIKYESLTGDDIFVATREVDSFRNFNPMEIEVYFLWNNDMYILSQGNPDSVDGWGLMVFNGGMNFKLYGTETGNFPVDERTWYKIKLDWDGLTLYNSNGELIEKFGLIDAYNQDSKPYYPLVIGGTYIDEYPANGFYGYIMNDIKIYDGDNVIDEIFAGYNCFVNKTDVVFNNAWGQADLIEEEIKEGYDGFSQVEVNVQGGNCDEIIENARVIDITENGLYTSRFTQDSDYEMPDEKTGDDFWSYATLSNQAYNTNITVTQDSVIELWYKGDNQRTDDGWNTIFGCAQSDDKDFYLGYMYADNTDLRGFFGGKSIEFTWDDTIWHHILMKNDGLWIDDVLIGSFNSTKTFAHILDINGTWQSFTRNANGCFGMIKIDDVVIIPTADGFLNTSTKELLEIVKEGSYEFTEIEKPIMEGELYRTINVNVIPTIKVGEYGVKLAYSTFSEIPNFFDFKGLTNATYLFYNCSQLQTIPEIDTSSVTSMDSMFSYCSNLVSIPKIDTSNVTNMTNMFNYCSKLQSIPEIDTSSVTSMDGIFQNCTLLQSVPPLNAQKLNMSPTYFGLFKFTELKNLTEFGGFIGLKYSLIGEYNFTKTPNLSYESCINILNGLYDFTGNGETPESNQGQLKVHQNFLNAVGDEISIGVLKGWTITA